MNMDRQMVVGVKADDVAEVLKDFRHCPIYKKQDFVFPEW
jgi:hypothetical protein